MLQFTIREMLWMTAVIALAIGWLLHARTERTNDQFLQIQLMEQRLQDAKALIEQLQEVKERQLASELLPPPPAVTPETASPKQPRVRKIHVFYRRLETSL